MEWNNELRKALRRPFPESAIKWKPQNLTKDKTRALAVAFIDARNVMERLDREVGPEGWSDDYEVLAATGDEFVVECALTILGVTKRDVGDSSAGSGSNLAKTAYSDAFKRAAVKFGIGRYIYALPKTWVEYDERRKRLTQIPELPSWARPPHLGEDPEEALPDAEAEPPVEESATEPTPKKPAAQRKATPPVGRPVEELIGTKAKREEAKSDGQHWSEAAVNTRSFWAQTTSKMKLEEAEVRAILTGAPDGHLADYPGSLGDALMVCRTWAVEQGRIDK